MMGEEPTSETTCSTNCIYVKKYVDNFAYENKTTKNRKRFLNFKWGVGDELILFNCCKASEFDESNPEDDTSMEQDDPQKGKVNVLTMSWDQTPEVVYQLTVTGSKLFKNLQINLPQLVSTPLKYNLYILNTSIKLREQIGSCCNKLDEIVIQLHQENQTINAEELIIFIEKLKVSNAIIHLVEVFLFNMNILVVNSFIQWTYEHYPRYLPEEFEAQLIQVRKDGDQSEYFWDLIYSFLLQGNTTDAWKYLKLHHEYQQYLEQKSNDTTGSMHENKSYVVGCLEAIKELLLNRPAMLDEVTDSNNSRINEYKNSFLEWQDKVIQTQRFYQPILNENSTNYHQNLADLLKILGGDIPSILKHLNKEYDSWAHLMSACLLYLVPTSHKKDCFELAQQCMYAFHESAETWTAIDQIQLHVLQNNFTKVVQLLHSTVGDRFVDCHLCELLAQVGAIETVSCTHLHDAEETQLLSNFLLKDIELDFREYFILQYAMQLGLGGRRPFHNEFSSVHWQLSSDYLGLLTRQVKALSQVEMTLGRPYVELMLSRTAIQTDREAIKLLLSCNRMGLPSLGSDICLVRAMRFWSEGGRSLDSSFRGASNALKWAKKSGGEKYLRLFLKQLFQHGSIESLDTLTEQLREVLDNQNMSTQMVDSNVLLLLREYYKLRELLRQASIDLALLQQAETSFADFDPVWDKRSKAIDHLCILLESKIVPERFWLPMMKLCLLWEQDNEIVQRYLPYVQQHTHCVLMMNKLESLHCNKYLDSAGKGVSIESNGVTKSELTCMRLILTQSLARCIISTGVSGSEMYQPSLGFYGDS